MEWVILIISLGVAAYLYYFKRDFFNKHKDFVEFALVVFAALFAIYQVQSSTDDFNGIVIKLEGIIKSAKQSTKSLKEVEKSLTKLPSEIDNFSSSIKELNKAVENQKDKLEGSLTNFNESIVGFQKSVDEMAKRFDRHPILKIDFKKTENDTNIVISDIVVTNSGNLLANVFMVRLQIDETSLDSIYWNGSIETAKQKSMRSFQMDFDNSYIVPNPTKPNIYNCNILLKRKKNGMIKVFIYYTSPFGNDGDANGIFAIKNKVFQKLE